MRALLSRRRRRPLWDAARPLARNRRAPCSPNTHHEQQVVADVARGARDRDLDRLVPVARQAGVLLWCVFRLIGAEEEREREGLRVSPCRRRCAVGGARAAAAYRRARERDTRNRRDMGPSTPNPRSHVGKTGPSVVMRRVLRGTARGNAVVCTRKGSRNDHRVLSSTCLVRCAPVRFVLKYSRC